MRPVAIIGIGQTKIDEAWEKSIRQIAVEAIQAALIDAGRESRGRNLSGQHDVGHHQQPE